MGIPASCWAALLPPVASFAEIGRSTTQTVTLLAAGAVNAPIMSINHATANANTVRAQALQVTTTRTSGEVAAFSGFTTSVGAGTYASFRAETPTDGGGAAVHTALLVKSGHDRAVDVSQAATGEAVWEMGDNLAVATRFAEDTNVYLDFVTTNSSESVAAKQRLTTTDGVAAGTARVVGGRAYGITATATVTNSKTEDDLGEYLIPAATIALATAGSVIRIRGSGKVTASVVEDLTVLIKFGADDAEDTLITLNNAAVAANDVFFFDVTIRQESGSSGSYYVWGLYHDLDTSGAALKSVTASTGTNDTTAAINVRVTANWTTAATGNVVRLDTFDVTIE